MKSRRWYALLLLAPVLLLPTLASATTFINNSSFGATINGVSVFRAGGADFIDWCPTNTGTPSNGAQACGTRNDAKGDLLVQPGTGNFLTLAPNTPGLILDMTDMSGATGPAPGAPYTFFPPGVPVAINDFITISTHPEWNFVAHLLVVPTCSGADICVGPFKFSQGTTVTGAPVTTFTMSVDGTVVDVIQSTSADFTTVITGEYVGLTAIDVIAYAQTASGAFASTVTSTTTLTVEQTPVPEPAALLLLGSGLFGLTGVIRWSRER